MPTDCLLNTRTQTCCSKRKLYLKVLLGGFSSDSWAEGHKSNGLKTKGSCRVNTICNLQRCAYETKDVKKQHKVRRMWSDGNEMNSSFDITLWALLSCPFVDPFSLVSNSRALFSLTKWMDALSAVWPFSTSAQKQVASFCLHMKFNMYFLMTGHFFRRKRRKTETEEIGQVRWFFQNLQAVWVPKIGEKTRLSLDSQTHTHKHSICTLWTLLGRSNSTLFPEEVNRLVSLNRYFWTSHPVFMKQFQKSDALRSRKQELETMNLTFHEAVKTHILSIPFMLQKEMSSIGVSCPATFHVCFCKTWCFTFLNLFHFILEFCSNNGDIIWACMPHNTHHVWLVLMQNVLICEAVWYICHCPSYTGKLSFWTNSGRRKRPKSPFGSPRVGVPRLQTLTVTMKRRRNWELYLSFTSVAPILRNIYIRVARCFLAFSGIYLGMRKPLFVLAKLK